MAKNANLNGAKAAKNDEFYTQLVDIENEVKHYRKHFKGATVLCNCDDPRCSNFFFFFRDNFEFLGLKKLIATCYKNQNVDLFSQNESERAVYQIYTGRKGECQVRELDGDGDFRSAECVELLKQSDIVCTNPPFSLFREFIALLEKYHKKYLVIGNKNAMKYKEIFPLMMANRLWIGPSIRGGDREFMVPQNYITRSKSLRMDAAGNKYIRVPGVHWFTNLDFKERHEDIPLYRKYSASDYPKYVNYNAISVDRTSEIPYDYDGLMGVPITFLDQYNPDQFEIIGMSLDLADMSVIRERLGRNDGGPTFYLEREGRLERLYDRIVIRRKKNGK